MPPPFTDLQIGRDVPGLPQQQQSQGVSKKEALIATGFAIGAAVELLAQGFTSALRATPPTAAFPPATQAPTTAVPNPAAQAQQVALRDRATGVPQPGHTKTVFRDPLTGRFERPNPPQGIPMATPVTQPATGPVPPAEPKIPGLIRFAGFAGASTVGGIGALAVDQETALPGFAFAATTGFASGGPAGAVASAGAFGVVVVGRAIFGDREARGILHDLTQGLIGEANEEIVILNPHIIGAANDP